MNAMPSGEFHLRVSAISVVELYFTACIILPSGSIEGLNVKQPLFAATLFVLGVRPENFAFTKTTARNAIFLTALLFAWVPLAFITGRSEGFLPLVQFKDIAVTATTAFLVAQYITDENRRDRFVRLVLYCVGFTSAIKALSFIYAAATGSSVVDIINVINHVFDQNLVTLDDGGIGARFQFVSDSLVPMAIYALLGTKGRFGISDRSAVILMALLVFSAVASFSRFLWLYSVIAIGLGLVTSRVDRTKLVYLILVVLVAAYFGEELNALYDLRTSDVQVDFSDSIRDEQRAPLYKFAADAPIFGHGLGTYTAEVIRESVTLYAYELQLVALIGQIGLVGTTIIALLVLYYYRGVFYLHRPVLQSLSIAVLILVWIASGFQNPWLASSSAGIAFGLLYSFAPASKSKRFPQRLERGPGHDPTPA